MTPLLAALLVAAMSQPWIEAFRSGRYEKAAELLHPIVIDANYHLQSRDPSPARALAHMYARGLGVPADPIGACSLAQVAEWVAQQAANINFRSAASYDASLAENQALTAEYCGRLSPGDQDSANVSAGCYAFGMREELLHHGGSLIRIGRRGIGIVDAPDNQVMGPIGCAQLVPLVRAVSIPPPGDAAPGVVARHIIQVFSWGLGHLEKSEDLNPYTLRWHIYEVIDGQVVLSQLPELQSSATWPSSLTTDWERRISFEMNRQGRVRWHIDGPDGRQGWLNVSR